MFCFTNLYKATEAGYQSASPSRCSALFIPTATALPGAIYRDFVEMFKTLNGRIGAMGGTS